MLYTIELQHRNIKKKRKKEFTKRGRKWYGSFTRRGKATERP